METLESSRICRLCGKQSGISINIFDANENHVKKINAVLPIMVHEMDLLPKQMCHRCSYKLEEFHKFYVDCLKTDADLKGQLSWMRREDSKERVGGVPMVHIENIKIKVEPPDYDAYNMNSMADNIDYINSMSSVTFPANGIRSNDISKGLTYAAYARCGCYCDKADRADQTVRANFDNRIPRCSRIANVRSQDNGCVNKSQAARANFFDCETFGEAKRLVTFADETTFDANPSKIKLVDANLEFPKATVVRNLRPRKRPVNYGGVKRRNKPKSVQAKGSTPSTMLDETQIKVEKLDEIAGRILRPRQRTIDYIGPKRRYSRPIGSKIRRSSSDKRRSSEIKVRNISNRLKLSRETPKLLENRLNVTIKEEQMSDLEESTSRESVSFMELSKNPVVGSIAELIDEIDALPNDRVLNVQNDTINRTTLGHTPRADGTFSIISRWKHLNNTPKSELRSRKIGSNRVAAINYSPKCLRSRDVHLRNGKIRKVDNADVSARKVRRSLRNLAERGKAAGRGFAKAIRDTVKKIPSSMKLVNSIKHYCEECNASFANKELFKLHACYGH